MMKTSTQKESNSTTPTITLFVQKQPTKNTQEQNPKKNGEGKPHSSTPISQKSHMTNRGTEDRCPQQDDNPAKKSTIQSTPPQPTKDKKEARVENKNEFNQLLLEFQGLRNTIKHNHEELTEKVESSVSLINVELQEVTSQLSAYHNTIEKVTVLENRVNELYKKNNKLCQENTDLQTRVMQLESLQLVNNVVLSRVPESVWRHCRDKIIEALSWTIYSKS